MVKLVADEWKVDAAGLKIESGVVSGGGKSMEWKQACKLISESSLSFSVSEAGTYADNNTESACVQFARLAVDVETGIVRVQKVVALQDMGQAVNRRTAENQICGAVIQAISFALFEDRILNRTNGAMVNPNLEMYKIAGPVDIPEIVPVIWQSRPDAAVNSLGEPPAVPGPGMIGCAIANAIGVPVRTMPMTPRRILAALAEHQGGTGGTGGTA
jgi:xanthine dehydrogenase YagR molybdenum-binding subunit